jgi:hypothetical protein
MLATPQARLSPEEEDPDLDCRRLLGDQTSPEAGDSAGGSVPTSKRRSAQVRGLAGRV